METSPATYWMPLEMLTSLLLFLPFLLPLPPPIFLIWQASAQERNCINLSSISMAIKAINNIHNMAVCKDSKEGECTSLRDISRDGCPHLHPVHSRMEGLQTEWPLTQWLWEAGKEEEVKWSHLQLRTWCTLGTIQWWEDILPLHYTRLLQEIKGITVNKAKDITGKGKEDTIGNNDNDHISICHFIEFRIISLITRQRTILYF